MDRAEIKERGLSVNRYGRVIDEYGNEFRDEQGQNVIVEPLKNCQGICPMCESEDVDYVGSHIEGESISYHGVCNRCDCCFDEWYDLKYSETSCSG